MKARAPLLVAQFSNLLYRRFSTCWRYESPGALVLAKARAIRASADWKSAIQQIGNLRYNTLSTVSRFLSIASLLAAFLPPMTSARAAQKYAIFHDPARQHLILADGSSNLVLRLDLDRRCVLDQVIVCGRQVAAAGGGVCTGIQVSNRWFTTCSNLPAPRLSLARNTITVSNIQYGGDGVRVKESWKFTLHPEAIAWEITRQYLSGGVIQDTLFPGWEFQDMATWTGGLLDHGGVAWNKYLDTPNASYVTHAGSVTFWNHQTGDCLRISSHTLAQTFQALRFSRQPAGAETTAFSVTAAELQPKHGLRRFHPSRQDLWAPFRVTPGEICVTFNLQALSYDAACNRGVFRGIHGDSLRELLNTIGRYGVIDRRIVGANGWRSGFACLHEQWFSQIGLALADPDYLANCAATFDFERDHAILPDGRIKSRWWYGAGDAMPGTYDPLGYYEAQWGYLLDSQTCFPICVAELFDLTGDRAWLRGQKAACERALEYLLRRDSDGNGLVEMAARSHHDQRGSDWIDIIWAAHENALVNAELYYALTLWSKLEDLLGDSAHAAAYRLRAVKLKTCFNRTTADGGFWDPQNRWYAYWRDQDGSVHGNNLVTPVNFAAIAYGLCDEPARRDAILRRIEAEMQKERLFFWPLSFFPYQPDEGHPNNFPFPKYENGDIFLSWGELAVRAYAPSDPALALKYVNNVLQRYEADGLSFQRYERQSQRGAGDDILAGNCMTMVGLYRDILGIQPKYNRLYLEPHLAPELNGTHLRYPLRGQCYLADLNTAGCALTAEDFTLRCAGPFGFNARGDSCEFFPADEEHPALALTRSAHRPLQIEILSWPCNPNEPRRWLESSGRSVSARHVLSGLEPAATYELFCDGRKFRSCRADAAGQIEFKRSLGPSRPARLTLRRSAG